MSIYIFTGPVHSGKTTELLHWCSQQNTIYGILMPDINGSRKILDLQTREIFDIECTDITNTNEPLTSVGKFNFYTAAFSKANLIISAALKQKPGWLIIDEAGKLELEGKGFYPGMREAVEFYSENTFPGNLLVTVRDSLYRDVIDFFNLKDYKVIHRLDDLIKKIPGEPGK